MTLTTDSIDHYLGDAAHRYFGDGFRNVGRSVGQLHRTDDPLVYRANARLTYPDTWSVKSTSSTLVPHLSSVDTLLIATSAARAAVASARGVPARAQHVRSVTISAGGSPVEDLDDVPFTVRLIPTPGGSTESTVEFTVASMRGSVLVSHPPVAGDADGDVAHSAPVLPIDGAALLDSRVSIDDVDASEVGTVTATATVSATSTGELSMVDALVCSAQLAQVLLYELDGIDRSHSDTLWMRRLTLTSATARPVAVGVEFPATVTARRTSVVTMGGVPWRSADLELTEFGGLTATCRVAHRLPGTRA
ncbi:hypothetical protein nbrc107696_10040 [Gordonia spumicola]|uniref:Avirulence D protein (AvrD) n=1 Tax=Gordonia spumicola TaxID=589161 RepID=A0A7I9V565_9ACTN|nr:AvrD family protein [Gordonia spumicola]GEE00558.1 hypothetical protein nbrc107696_10040 [Gordonia spumicola]